MSEGIVSIGATFDKTNIDAGMTETQEIVKASMGAISSSVTEAGSKTKAAWKNLSEDVKIAAQSVSAEALKVAETSRAVSVSQADVRRAFTLTKDAAVPTAESMSYLAAAQIKLAEDQAAAAKAQAASLAETTAAAAKAALSPNAMIASFQKAGMEVRASLTGMQEKMVEVAETGKLSAEGITAGFAGLGSLLGAGMVAGFATHFLDETAKVNVQLGILSEKTGIAVPALAGLRQIAKENGESMDIFDVGLARLVRSMGLVEEGNTATIKAFASIGIEGKELADLLNDPEAMLYRVAQAMGENYSQGVKLSAAQALMGRGGMNLVPILEKEGSQLKANTEAAAAKTGEDEKAVEVSKEWTKNMAELSAAFTAFGNDVFRYGGPIVGVFDGIGATVQWVVQEITAFAVKSFAALSGVAKAGWDLAHGNLEAVKNDFMTSNAQIKYISEDTARSIGEAWKSTWDLMKSPWTESTAVAPKNLDNVKHKKSDDEGDTGSGGVKGGHSSRAKSSGASGSTGESAESTGGVSADVAFAIQSFKYEEQEMTRMSALFKQVNADTYKEEVAAARDAAEKKIRFAREDFENFQKDCDSEVKIGKMTESDRVAAVKAASERERQIYQQESAEIQRLDRGNVTALRADKRQQEEETRQYNRKIVTDAQKAALDVQKNWKKSYDQMTNVFASNIDAWITKQQTFAQAWNKTFISMTNTLIQNVLKQTIAYVAGINTEQAAEERQKMSDAAAAARKAFVAIVGIPFVGPVLAPVAAATAFAAVEAFDAGGVVGNGMGVSGTRGYHVPILAEAGERVLSAKQTANFERMVSQSNSSSSVTNHNNVTQNIQAWDRHGIKSMLGSHADDILDIVQGGISSGKLSVA